MSGALPANVRLRPSFGRRTWGEAVHCRFAHPREQSARRGHCRCLTNLRLPKRVILMLRPDQSLPVTPLSRQSQTRWTSGPDDLSFGAIRVAVNTGVVLSQPCTSSCLTGRTRRLWTVMRRWSPRPGRWAGRRELVRGGTVQGGACRRLL